MADLELYRGDLVEVRSAKEILATLDAQGRHEGLPFMPEMIPFCGHRFTVWRRADKVCDTVDYSGSRRLHDGVILGDLRCDGSAHDGCQAECRIFWKTAWLRPVSGVHAALALVVEDVEALRARTQPYTRSVVELAQRTNLPTAVRTPICRSAPSSSASGTRAHISKSMRRVTSRSVTS